MTWTAPPRAPHLISWRRHSQHSQHHEEPGKHKQIHEWSTAVSVCVCVSKREGRIITTTVLVTAGERTLVAVSPARFSLWEKSCYVSESRSRWLSRCLCCCCWFTVRAFWWLPSPSLFLPMHLQAYTAHVRVCKCCNCISMHVCFSLYVFLLISSCSFAFVVVEKTRARCISRLVSRLGAQKHTLMQFTCIVCSCKVLSVNIILILFIYNIF